MIANRVRTTAVVFRASILALAACGSAVAAAHAQAPVAPSAPAAPVIAAAPVADPPAPPPASSVQIAPPVQAAPSPQPAPSSQPAPSAPSAPPAEPAPQTPIQPPQETRDLQAAGVESYYRLQPSDTVFVKYRYTPEYDATVTLRPDGYITLPIVGEVRIVGLTVAEAHREIVKVASLRLRDPELTVELKDFLKPRIVVGGEVAKPGQFELRGRVTLLEAVAMAGGFKTSAKHSQVVLFRRHDTDTATTRIVNAKDLIRADARAEDPLLQPGDMLYVPQNRISKIERFVPIASIGWLMNIMLR